ncbi:GNAT family protein [Micromonospora sp. NPDC005413]|uniref:GNAT family N-acetyltransferase n=1 Tax=Micromonospora sp. NPDC005413 TaxID=3154563 RepID=UPI0033A193E7
MSTTWRLRGLLQAARHRLTFSGAQLRFSTAQARLRLLAVFPPVKIVSSELEIREFGPQDVAQVAAFVAAEDRTALPPGSPEAVADVDEWLAATVHRRRLDGEGVHLAMVQTASGEIVGSLGLRDTDWRAGRSEIGYGVRASRRGRGHATEAARAVGRWALTEGGMRRIQMRVRLDNVVSLRVAEKAGYHREGILRMVDWDGEKAHDLAVFSMIATDLETAETAH